MTKKEAGCVRSHVVRSTHRSETMLLLLDGLTEGRVPQFRHIARLGYGHADAAVRQENIEGNVDMLSKRLHSYE